MLLWQVPAAQAAVKAAQQVLADVRKVFSDRAQAKKAAKEAKGLPASKAKPAAKKTPKAKVKA